MKLGEPLSLIQVKIHMTSQDRIVRNSCIFCHYCSGILVYLKAGMPVKIQGDPDRRYRVDMSQRVAMYRDVINFIRSWYHEPVIGLCKETNGVWAAMVGMYSNQVLSDECNCTL